MLDAAADTLGSETGGDARLVGFNGFNAHALPGGTPQAQAFDWGGDQRSFQTPNNLEFFEVYGGMSGHGIQGTERRAWSQAGMPERNYEGPTWIDAGQAEGEDRLTPEVRARREALDAEMQGHHLELRRCPDDLVDEARSYRARRHSASDEEHFQQLLAEVNAFLDEVNQERVREFWKEFGGSDGGERYSTRGMEEFDQEEARKHGHGYAGEFEHVGVASRRERRDIRIARDQQERSFADRFPDTNMDVVRRHFESEHGHTELDQGDAGYIFDYVQALDSTLPDLQQHEDRFAECFVASDELIDHYEVVKDGNGLRLFIPMLGLKADAEPEMWREMYISGQPPREKFYFGPKFGEPSKSSEMTPIDYKQHTREIIRRAMAFDEFKRTIDSWVDRRQQLIATLEPFMLAVQRVQAQQSSP